ncbi:MAG TPA: class I SAM-dependent methyltransferase [Solirubrobacterales bacterium]
MAPIYDRFNEANDYEVWLGEVLLPELEKHGLGKGRVLDVGCGTGRAFAPLVRRGWEVWGFDGSPAMVERARAKNLTAPVEQRAARIFRADARELSDIPLLCEPFDLVLLLNDVVNYLTEDGDLERCFSGVKRNLAEGGLVCFDANTLGLFRSSFAVSGEDTAPLRDRGWKWTGLAEEIASGGIFEAELSGEGVEPHLHRQRHWTREEIEAAMDTVGLSCLAVLGQREDGARILLEQPPDEELHYKSIYFGGLR